MPRKGYAAPKNIPFLRLAYIDKAARGGDSRHLKLSQNIRLIVTDTDGEETIIHRQIRKQARSIYTPT